MRAKSLQLCPILYDPVDCSLPGSFIHGILQVRILEWVALLSTKGSSQPRDQTQVSSLLHWQEGSLPLAPPGFNVYHVAFSVSYPRSHWNTNSTSTVSLEPALLLPHFPVLIQVMLISFTYCIRMALHKSLGLPLMVAKQLTQLSTIHL